MTPNIFTLYPLGVPHSRYTGMEVEESGINRGTARNPRPMLKFHTVHGANVHLNTDKTVARRRATFFCKGLAFSDR